MMINKLIKSDFLKYIVILMSGTMIAQFISLGSSVIIFRYFYSPAEAADWGLFMRVVGVGAAIATARYELALPVAKINVHSFRLYHIALRSTIIVAIVTSIAAIFPIILASSIDEVIFYGMIPVGLALSAFYNIGTNWAIRTRKFRSISLSKIANNGFASGAKIGFGYFGVGPIGLILGTVIGLAAANIWFVRDFFSANREYAIKSRSPRNFVLAKQYSEFPKVNMPHVMMDLGRDLVFALLMVKLFTKTEFGLFDHSYRMLRMPLMLAGLAISQVFFQQCAERYNKGMDLFPMVFKAVKVLFLISLVPFTVVFLFGDDLFAWVFSEEWRGAGEDSQIMAFWFMLNFISSPISFLPLVIGKQRIFFLIATIGAISMILCLVIPPYFFQADLKTTLIVVSVSQIVYFLIVIFKTFQYVKRAHLDNLNVGSTEIDKKS